MPASPAPGPSPTAPPPPKPKPPRSPAQAAASRANGARSGGPVSEAGKARSRLNGVTHGLTVQATSLLPQIDQAGFTALAEQVAAGCGGVLAAAELDQLTATLWLRQRATAHEMALLSTLDAQIRAGAFRPHDPAAGEEPAEAEAAAARDDAADRQLKRLLLYARYGTRIRRELDRLTARLEPQPPKAAPAARAREAAPAARPGSGREDESGEFKSFSGSLGNIQPPPPLPTDPDADRALRRLTLDALGLEGTETFILGQLEQQGALPPAELLLETDRTLAFWHSDGVALPRVQRWRDQLATRLATGANPPDPSDPLSRRAGEGRGEGIGAAGEPPQPEPPPAPDCQPYEPSPAPTRGGREGQSLSPPGPAAARAPSAEPETLEQQVLRLFQDPVPRQPSDLALADSLVANLCYRKKETFGTIRLFDLLDLLDRLRDQGRIAHPDILNRLAGDAFAADHHARFGPEAA